MGKGSSRARQARWRWAGFLALLLILGGARPVRAQQAAGNPVLSFEQSDVDGDGAPDSAVIRTSGTNGITQVAVYDGGRDMAWAETWEAGTDLANDAWVFEDGGGTAKLILCFSRSGGQYRADLYDDAGGDGAVAFRRLPTGGIDVTESSFPTVRMTADRPWVLPDGSTNYLVHAVVYRAGKVGDIEVPFASDGSPAIEIEIRDQDGDGAPDYELVRYFPDIPPDWKVGRTYINVNVDDSAPAGFAEYFLWPYLDAAGSGVGEAGSLIRTPGDLRPPVRVDWHSGTIEGMADMLPRWGDGMHWLFNSFTPLLKGAANSLTFERFGQYRFSGSAYPDMIIRHSLAQTGFEEAASYGGRNLYTDQVSLSWHHQSGGALVWDYKLELAGLQPVPDTTVEFSDFGLREVPYADWPAFFTEQQWAYATFVDTEGNGYATNEAIYEWTTVEGALLDLTTRKEMPGASQGQIDYLLGRADESPARYYPDIREGFRGEYADLNGRASLYISPVDHKLHLTGADHGVWNLGGDAEIRYANLDDDAHLDQWQYIEGGEVRRRLNSAGAFLIYGEPDRILIKQAVGMPAAREALPPRSREEWLSLGQELGAARRYWAPENLSAMLDQFVGPETEIRGAEISDFRPTRSGFRFVLDLHGGYSVHGAGLLPVAGLGPGRYLVAYDGRLSVEPLTVAAVSVDIIQVDAEPVLSQTPFSVEVRIANRGLEDAHGLALVVQAESGGKSFEVARQEIAALGGEVESLPLTWQPPAGGRWVLRVDLASPDGTEQATTKVTVSVAEGERATAPLVGFGAVPWWAGLLLALVAVLNAAAIAAARRAEPPEDGA